MSTLMIDNFFVSENFKMTANCKPVKVFVRGFGPCFQVHLLNLSSTFIGFDVLIHCVTANSVHRNLLTLMAFTKKGERSPKHAVLNAHWSEI